MPQQADRHPKLQGQTDKPQVLFVSRKWPPAVGGMETYGVKLSEALKAYADVALKVLPGQTDGSAPTFGRILAFGLSAAARVMFARPRPDVVHVADMSSWPLAALARLSWPGAKVVMSAHGTDVAFGDRIGAKPWMYRQYMRTGAWLAGRITTLANSRATADKLAKLGFHHTEVVALATDMTASGDGPARTSTQKTILFAGRLVPRKGCRWFIEHVLPNLPQDVELQVAGTKWNKSEEVALSSPKVRYIGALAPQDLARAYGEASVVVVPNISIPGEDFEGFGLVAAEAASAGGLVLAAAHSGLNDAVIDGVTGFHLPPGDAEAWIAKLTEVLSWNADQRTAFIETATKAAQTHYAWDRVGRDTFEAYGLSH